MRKRVLIIDPADFVGGAELFNVDLVCEIQKNTNYTVEVLTGDNQQYRQLLPKKTKIHHFEFPRLKLLAFKSLGSLKEVSEQLREFIMKGNYDLIQTNSVRAHIITSLAISGLPIQLVWYLHDYTFPHILLMGLKNYPGHIVCCSHGVKESVLSALTYSQNECKTKISVIPSGVNLEVMRQITQETPIKSKEDGITRFAIVGRIDPWKGQDVFLKAAAIILKKFRSVHFSIIGQAIENDEKTESFYAELQRLTRGYGIESHVTFTGFQKDLFPYLAGMDCVVHCSTDREPLGRTVIEAMALEKAVIASNFGGPKEIISHLTDGILIPPGDPAILADVMQKMIQDTSLRTRLSQNAPKKIEQHFTTAGMTAQLTQVWESTLRLNQNASNLTANML